MKKIILFLVSLCIFLFGYNALFASGATSSSSYSRCRYSDGVGDISSFLEQCKPATVVGGGDMRVEGGFKTKVNRWIANISVFL